MTQWVYTFGDGNAEGKASMKNLLGGKGANLAEMCNLKLPVPPGFTITTEVCKAYYDNEKNYPSELKEQLRDAVASMEAILGTKFGDTTNPLLVSVRSGARISMPGMMDTVLNLGLNDETVEGLAKKSRNPQFAYDSYRRFIQMYGEVVLGIKYHVFEELLENAKRHQGVFTDSELTTESLQALCIAYKNNVEKETGKPFPQNPEEQLWGAISAVFDSWMNNRAITYRRINNISSEWGTAVNIQAMVFGNMGDDCATGVAFTRNPSTGENAFYGEYLVNAQGEDVVAGIRTPEEIATMKNYMPIPYKDLEDIYHKLERHYKDMQDLEFTVQNNKLWMLQTRSGKRTTKAAIRIAVDMVAEGLIDKAEAVRRIEPESLDQLLHPTLDPSAVKKVIARGLAASPGAVSGAVVFSAEEAEEKSENGEKTILVRIETSPEDIHGMYAANGILTARGGMTSHAAVVARGMGRACVSGAGDIHIDYKKQCFTADRHTVNSGDIITIDGSTGEIMLGEIATIAAELSDEFSNLMEWADDIRTLKIRTNAETPEDAAVARKFGAEGIGLCRTEHMFFDADRISKIREMIIADSIPDRQKALAQLLPYQKEDFIELFTIMAGLPVTVRLLDPPLHEFLPHTEKEIAELADLTGVSIEKLNNRIESLTEQNPMLGHRGCRLGITYPEIYEMQAQAIFEACVDVLKNGEKVIPEIMIPLVVTQDELSILKEKIAAMADFVASKSGINVEYKIGTMIELPRAALMAGEIAQDAEFFSFGTNDLTQTTFGISRDDSASFISVYKAKGIFANDPFVSLDIEGVGELIRIATERGRATRPDIKLGICGEHGGDPASIAFCQEIGLDYVSCSPYRVPIARLAAARAVLK